VAQANFDAEIRLDIGPFIASIQKAQSEVAKLSQQIDTLNKKTVSPTVSISGGAGPVVAPSVGASSQERMAAAKQEIRAQEQLGEVQARRAAQGRKDSQQQDRNLARERYALYDVAAAYTAVAGAASLAVVATAGTAINFERAFADVARTTDFTSAKIGAAAESAMNDLKTLASEIPVAFGQITQIATIGNQLGIAQGSLTSFTETVAKFSATTGVSVDATAMAFGRIGELLQVPAQEFESLGSAIAFAGVNAVATEEQILSVTKEIATTAKMAKFSSADIIGLSTALSSLGIAPEAARGSIIRTFAGINKVISEGGRGLEQYASIAGMSAEQFASTWQKNGQEAFSSLLGGLQNLAKNGENLDSVLRNLGMVNVRDIQTIQKLGDNYDVYTASIREANQGFEEGTFLGQAYGVIQETVASKLALVTNNWSNLLDTLGQGAVGEGFKDLLDGVNELLVTMNALAKSPVGQFLGGVAAIVTIATVAIAGLSAVSALAGASVRAFVVAQESMTLSTAKSTGMLATFTRGLNAVAASSTVAAGSLNKTQVAVGAITTTLRAAKWLLIFSAVTHAVTQMGIAFSSAEQKAETMLGGFSGLQDALTSDLQAYNTALNDLGGDVAGAEKATGVIAGLNTEIENNNDETNKAIRAQNALNTLVGLGSNNTSILSSEVENLNFVIGANTRAWIANAIAQSDAFQKLSQNTDAIYAITNAGFNLDVALQAAASGNLDTYLDGITQKAIQSASPFEQFIYSLDNATENTAKATEGMGFFGDALTTLVDNIATPIAFIGKLINSITLLVGLDLFPVSAGLDGIRDSTTGAINQMRILGAQLDRVNNVISEGNANEYADQLENIDKKGAGAAKSLRTVIDYANDLRGIFSRAFEIRFGQQDALDQIASGWKNITDKADGATDAIKKANDEIQELTADRSILEYQLTVAERYGDEQRAAVIRAKIAKIDSNVADKKEDIKKATEDLSKSTEGNTESSIENRKVLVQQVQDYAALIEMYSKTGLKGKELKAKVKELKQEFIEQGIQAGFSRQQLLPYTKAFDDMRETINKTPRNVNVEFKSNVSAAKQAVNEYISKLREAGGTFTTTLKLVLPTPGSLPMIINPSDYKLYRKGLELGRLTEKEFYKAVYGLSLQSKADGGLIKGPGSGTSDSIPAMLSNGEYVVKASAVGTYGVDFLNALNQQKVGSFGSTTGAVASASGSTVAYLSPEDRALLRAAIDRPVNLYTENAKIASSANAGNVVLAQRGTN
jgi:TP901 family phage tail tape measure protein